MTVYVVTNGQIETGSFESFREDLVEYRTDEGVKRKEHPRNVFFDEMNARRHHVRQLGILRPIKNGSS